MTEHTHNEQRKETKRPTTSRFSNYFTIWDKRFTSLTRFPPNIWLQSFEHCFTESHGENRGSSIYCHASSVNYHVYFLQDTRFIFFLSGFCVSRERERLLFLAPPYHFHLLRKSFGLQHLHLSERFNDEQGLCKRIQEPYYIFLLSKPL